MSFVACYAGLENLVAKPDKQQGLGLLWLTNKQGSRFIIEYRQDWKSLSPPQFK
jgi:hypothetical protein